MSTDVRDDLARSDVARSDGAGVDTARAEGVLGEIRAVGLLSTDEVAEVLGLLHRDTALADVVRAAESIHLHVKVADVDALLHDRLAARGLERTSGTEGYAKYTFPGGINLIVSSIPVAEDDLLGPDTGHLPHLDHKGLDLRDETPEVRAIFDAVPGAADADGWRHVGQGGGDRAVYCCHTEVSEKHWLYPAVAGGRPRPIEVAYGALRLHDEKMGCDLRPTDPADPHAARARAAQSTCSGGATPCSPAQG